MRLTIARKIALAVVGTVIVSLGTMAWLASQNLQRGFIEYLNEGQTVQLEQLRDMLADAWRERGNFEFLRHNPRAMREFFDRIRQHEHPDDERVPPPRVRDRPEVRNPPRPYGAPAGPNPLAPSDESRPPGVRAEAARTPARDPRDDRPPPPENAPPRREPPDAMDLGPRLTILDEEGRPLLGPPDVADGIARAVVVDGRTVATLVLRPLRVVGSTSGTAFVRGQARDLGWLALALVLLSGALAVGLARHMLRPIAGLRQATQRIAEGGLDARAPVLGHDELAELAHHVNSMAASLEANEQQRRQMLADVAHELRTPLTVIRGEIEALIDGIRKADPAALQSLHAEALHLNKLIDDLHQLALADAGALHYQFAPVDLTATVEQVVKRYYPRAQAVQLSLEADLTSQSVWVNADAGRLTQVVTNLLENSVRYTDPGGRIVVQLGIAGRQAELCVEDTAPGVPEGAHARLFERLYRVDQARTRQRGGSGLGLAICKTLVEAHGGTIAALPSTLGGVKMLIRIPLLPQ
jgi:two-component system sensor histidine kinase BaeS